MTDVGVLEREVPPKKMGRPGKNRNDVSVRLDAKVASRARYVARANGESIAEYLTRLIEPLVNRDFAKVGKTLEESAD